MKKFARHALSLLLALTMLFGLTVPALAADTAAVMKLSKTEGTVTVTNASGRSMPILADMRLYSGYTIETAAASYAWINLDDTKLVKLNERSKVELRKSGKKLEVLIIEGEIYGDVSKKLSDDESLHVRTATAIAGIRGTQYQVKKQHKKINMKGAGKLVVVDSSDKGIVISSPKNDTGKDSLTVVSGEVEVINVDSSIGVVLQKIGNALKAVTDLKNGSVTVSGGSTLQVGEQEPPKPLDEADLSGSTQTELTKNGSVTISIPGGNMINITPEQAQQRQKEDEERSQQEAAQTQGSGQQQSTGSAGTGDNTKPVWGDSGESSKPSGGTSSGSGSSGGGSSSGSHRPSRPDPSPDTYTVTFETGEGSAVPPQTVTEGGTVSEPAAPTREGFDFDGWYTDADCTQPWDFTTKVFVNLTLYAKWTEDDVPPTPGTYTVTFNTGEGSTVPPQTVAEGETASEPAAPTREGYIFGGWYTDADCTQPWNFTTKVFVNLTLYAKWTVPPTPGTYTVTFETNGGSAVTPQTVAEGGTASEPTEPTKTGYTFGGWYTDSGCTQPWDFTTAVTSNLTLYAKWTKDDVPETYTVTFETGEGSAVPPQTVTEGKTASEPTAPTREGCTFGGWYTDADCTQPWDFTTAVTRDLTLYAKWTENVPPTPDIYTITFDPNGGAWADGTSADRTAETNESGTITEGFPADPVREGYIFTGWADASGKVYTTASTFVESLTLSAQWTKKPYTVTFYPNGGTLSGSNTAETNADGIVKEPTAPTREHYSFMGWCTDAACQQPVWAFDTVVTADMTLYAKWARDTYTVTFNSNGGTAVTSQTVNSGEKATEPTPAPTKDGYTFSGWFADAQFETSADFSQPITSIVTFYAKWTPVSYTVNFNTQGGTDIPSQTVVHNQLVSEPGATTRTDYEFGGWFTNESCTIEADFSKPVTSDLTFFAKWIPIDKSVKVLFDSQGGSAVEALATEKGQSVSRPTDPTRAEHAFAGWFIDAECTQAWDFSNPVSDNMTLYAKWVASYVITFNANGGAWTDGQETVTRNTDAEGKVTFPEDPQRQNYTFKGWADSSGTAYTDADTFREALKLSAQWQPIQYTVTFNSNGGSQVDSQTVNSGATATEPTPAPTMAGYDFDGWFTDAELTIRASFPQTVTSDLTFYAKWTKLHNVSFDSNGGTTIYPQMVRDGTSISEPTEPTKEGHKFDGWFTDAELTTKASFPQPVTSDLFFYAKWTPNQYTVTFDSDGGDRTYTECKVEYGKPVQNPESDMDSMTKPYTGDDKENVKWRCDGWYTEPNRAGKKWDFATDTVTDNLTLYAGWYKSNKVKLLDYDGTTIVKECWTDANSHLQTPDEPVKDGYHFLGWHRGTDGLDAPMLDFESEYATFSAGENLYSQWRKIETVIFDYNYADTTQSPITCKTNKEGMVDPKEYEETLVDTTVLTEPKRSGYKFLEWNSVPTGSTAQNNSTVYPFEKPVSPSEGETEVKLYAQWARVVELTGNSDSDNKTLKSALESSDKTIIIQAGSADEIVIPSTSTLSLDDNNKKLIISSGVTVTLQGQFEIVQYELENNGTFIADSGCTFTNRARFINQHEFINNTGAQVANKYSFVNNGTHINKGQFNNYRDYKNDGEYQIDGGTFSNLTENNITGSVAGQNKHQITVTESTGG